LQTAPLLHWAFASQPQLLLFRQIGASPPQSLVPVQWHRESVPQVSGGLQLVSHKCRQNPDVQLGAEKGQSEDCLHWTQYFLAVSQCMSGAW
jgi:hypothetical protein